MPAPKTDEGLGPQQTSTSGNYVIGFWWSNADWQWWPYYLWEAREATGQPDLTVSEAKAWADQNEFYLRNSIPAGGGPPAAQGPGNPYDPDSISYDSTGRAAPSGGGRGGGRSGPSYVAPNYEAPDEESVRESVKAYVVATTGTADKEIIDAGVRQFMSTLRSNFDAGVAADRQRVMEGVSSDYTTTDPMTKVKELVRNTAAYRAIHELRPESVDEMDWVTSRQAKLRQLGLSAQAAERLGVRQAEAGANDQSLVKAGEMQFNTDTGLLFEQQRRSLADSARAALRLV